jgi:hypothetical protein
MLNNIGTGFIYSHLDLIAGFIIQPGLSSRLVNEIGNLSQVAKITGDRQLLYGTHASLYHSLAYF